eukprot:gb/GECH01012013.1/.p1 GENE.gb/GECH01012013.1/~~gb/GECH01012013.1/.p1  ORF type:complete len:785 (+),score=242.39 gb/GECH01012013.1/:1-2355(+)
MRVVSYRAPASSVARKTTSNTATSNKLNSTNQITQTKTRSFSSIAQPGTRYNTSISNNSVALLKNTSKLSQSRKYSQSKDEEAEVVDAKDDFVKEEPKTESKEESEKSEDNSIEEPTVKGAKEENQFQAETKRLLEIVTHSLYTDKEIFIRELISNSSDALEKMRHLELMSDVDMIEPGTPLSINITVNSSRRQFVIQDSGIGMNKEELKENLGTIALSGSKAFVKQLQEQNSSESAANIIGQFGVGFYSAFMVAEKVRVYTRSYKPDSIGYCWESTGHGDYTISEAEGVSRGTKIVIDLMDSEREFALKDLVEKTIKKYSNFVGFDINVNGEKVNTVEAIWLKDKQSVSQEQYTKFFQYLTHNNQEEPRYTLHFTTDAPISIHSIMYIPRSHMEKFGMGKQDPGINLYSRKVLIKAKASGILPEWMRFVRGVVDSEDLPLNLSREHLQDSALIKRISSVLTRRILNYLKQKMKDRESYGQFFDEFGTFLKEGACTDAMYRNELAELMIFETSKTKPGDRITLKEYVERMQEGQKEVYYVTCASRDLGENSPYFEAFRKKDMEVIFLYGAADEFTLSAIGEYKGKKLTSIESNVDISAESDSKQRLNPLQLKELGDWIRKEMRDQIKDVKPTDRLVDSPAIVIDHTTASMRRVMRSVESMPKTSLPKQTMEINPAHPIIMKLYSAMLMKPDVAKVICAQVYDNALAAAGLLDDLRVSINRVNQLMGMALTDVPMPDIPEEEEDTSSQEKGKEQTQSEEKNQQFEGEKKQSEGEKKNEEGEKKQS